ncbi:MAG: FAD-binding oxidoreductase [Candidatus Hydrogenedentota bacterium]|nr:MAG: FAD-binding oxidoreductase [Candidatus Hydrogenedentota bacterium]
MLPALSCRLSNAKNEFVLTSLESWGRTIRSRCHLRRLRWVDEEWHTESSSCLAVGERRSYGDVCLPREKGTALDCRSLDRILHFDPEAMVLTCEAGLRFSALLDFLVPRGFFPPVVPGTKGITVGGAVANDIHGKNHHKDGSFGNHVLSLTLRHHGRTIETSPQTNPHLFRATIGGLGLTGLIQDVTFRLRRIPSSWLLQEHIPFSSLETFLDLDRSSSEEWPYTVSWIDWASRSPKLFGRGVFIRGRETADIPSTRARFERAPTNVGTIPFRPPLRCLSEIGLSLYNSLTLHTRLSSKENGLVHFDPFFFPLDHIENWNLLYGPKGFFQYQAVFPEAKASSALEKLEKVLFDAPIRSFLTVLKRFGSKNPTGYLSFPRAGITVALDFPNIPPHTLDLMERIDQIVLESGGALYPAKDARMSPSLFRHSFPNHSLFREHIDPLFASRFSDRIGLTSP